MIFVVLGPDRSLARAAMKSLVAEHDPLDQNSSSFDALSDPIDSVLNAVSTPSFFGGSRVVVATGYVAKLRPSGSAAGGARSKRAKSPKPGDKPDVLESVLSIALGHQVLILHEPELSALPTSVKGLIPDSVPISVHNPPRGTALIEFTRKAFDDRGASIDRSSAQFLLDTLFPAQWQQAASNPAFDRPPDIETLLTEVDKLALAAGNDEVTEEIIAELTPSASADRLFPLLDAVVSGNARQALHELSMVPDVTDERSRLLAQLFQQIEYAAAASLPGRPPDPLQAGKELGMSNPNRMKAILRSVGTSNAGHSQSLQDTLQADRRIKHGLDSDPGDAIFRLIRSGSQGRRSAHSKDE